MSERVKVLGSAENYDAYLSDARCAIDRELSILTHGLSDLKLCDKISYVLGTRGKRLRPLLVMLSAQSLGGNPKRIMKLALSVELLHASTLVHDDILDNDCFRRSALTPNAKWGVRNAVLVGDALASLSFNLVCSYGKEVVEVFSDTCLQLSEGEYRDIENASLSLKEQEYWETINRKSASLFRAAARCGALAAEGSTSDVEALSGFGENFGLAYQIRDDLSDVSPMGGAPPQDIEEFRTTLPIIHFLDNAEQEAAEEFRRLALSVKTQNLEGKGRTVEKLHERLAEAGSLEYCARRIDEHVEKAIDRCSSLRETVYRDYLARLANSLRI